jgi:hypothetical protein
MVSPDDVTDTLFGYGRNHRVGYARQYSRWKDAALYEHSIRWRVKDGDFDGTGAAMAPHQKPMWQFNGGGLSIQTPT